MRTAEAVPHRRAATHPTPSRHLSDEDFAEINAAMKRHAEQKRHRSVRTPDGVDPLLMETRMDWGPRDNGLDWPAPSD